MIYVLDTDHLSVLTRGGGASLQLQMRLEQIPMGALATTVVTYEEQMHGWMAWAARASTAPALVESYSRLLDHIATFAGIPILPFDAAAASHLEQMHRSAIRIGTMDRRIAAITVANNATLLTRNTSDFEKIPGLRFEDWTA